MTLRSVRDRYGREILVEVGAHRWSGYRRAQENRDRFKSRMAASEVMKVFKEQQANPVERIPVGIEGHWISHQSTASDGRERWGVYPPDGGALANSEPSTHGGKADMTFCSAHVCF